ncbi:hypothetical protein [Limibacillus sp. MBR-115]|jgi:hypothetical protein|uniref:hypothetical protein n=1 Tax=Limibacillus sp. MBR-115 TaxID=3156465 RepID=UPI0033983DB0
MLSNPKHETFARLLVQGVSASEAYEKAGYKPNRQNAHKLAKEYDILRRVDELQSLSQQRHDVTVDGIQARLEDSYRLAEKQEKPADMRQAAMDMAKLHGLVIDRAETRERKDYTIAWEPITEEEWDEQYGDMGAQIARGPEDVNGQG